jgi:hypothetical protein
VFIPDHARVTTFHSIFGHDDLTEVYASFASTVNSGNGNELVHSFPVLDSDEYDVIINYSIGHWRRDGASLKYEMGEGMSEFFYCNIGELLINCLILRLVNC